MVIVDIIMIMIIMKLWLGVVVIVFLLDVRATLLVFGVIMCTIIMMITIVMIVWSVIVVFSRFGGGGLAMSL